jgi:S1-C subfamily serine protease
VTTVLGSGDALVPESIPAAGTPKRRWNAALLRRNVLVGLVLIWAVAITAVVLFRGGGTDTSAAVPSASPSRTDGPLSVAETYQFLRPSVVLIRSARDRSPADGDAGSMAESATGTGVIVNADGTVLTAAHVIAGAAAIEITYADGTKSAAVVASADAEQDVATLTPATLPETVVPAVLGGGLQVGDDVVAVGNPLGLTASTTSGVVAGLNRSTRTEVGAMSGLVQFDAAVNPGSSGGPLVNDRGQVVGVVVALANPTDAGTFIGIGFAVPIGAALGAGAGDGRPPPL